MRLISILPQLPLKNEPHLWRCLSTTLLGWTILSCIKNIQGQKLVCICASTYHLSRGCLRVQVHNEIPGKPYDGISIHHQKNVYLSHTANWLWKKQERIPFFFSNGSSQLWPFLYHNLQWKSSQTSRSITQAVLSTLGIPSCIIKHAFILACFSAKYFCVHPFLSGSKRSSECSTWTNTFAYMSVNI